MNEHNLNHLIEYIILNYSTFGKKKVGNRSSFGKLNKTNEFHMSGPKPIFSFKKILFPNKLDSFERTDEKIAFIGLNNCDIWALKYFLDQFKKTNLLPKREDILIVGTECQVDRNCFCELMGTNKYSDFDLFIQDEPRGFTVFSGTRIGEQILKKIGLKNSSKEVKLKEIKLNLEEKPFDQKELSKKVSEKNENIDFWQGISNNCFGCSACSTVCPLCFCFRQEFVNNIDESGKRQLRWDSCFSKGFSEIQHHFDLRPQNVDRLYNWYHHKFVRNFEKKGYFLCTGCGRCIDACPANLNQKNILNSLVTKEQNK